MFRTLKISLVFLFSVFAFVCAAMWVRSYFICESYFWTQEGKVVEGVRVSRGTILLFRNTPQRLDDVSVRNYLLGRHTGPSERIDPSPIDTHSTQIVYF